MNVLLLSSGCKNEDMVHKKGGRGQELVADYDSSVQLYTDANFHTLAVTNYRLMHNYVEIPALIVLNILHHKPTVVECCVLFTGELEVSCQIMPL